MSSRCIWGETSQLLDSLDPSPFDRRDLTSRAEAYIVDSVEELPPKAPPVLVVKLDQSSDLPGEARVVENAIRTHSSRRSHGLRRDLHQLIHRGLISLVIALSFMVLLFTIAQAVGQIMGNATYAPLVRESMLIVGWVALWRPVEIFLYDWWPIVSQRRLHDRLSRISVRVVYTRGTTGDSY
jgi:hypothetical protein